MKSGTLASVTALFRSTCNTCRRSASFLFSLKIQQEGEKCMFFEFVSILCKSNLFIGRVPLPKAEAFEIERMRHTSGTSLLSSGSSQSGNSMGVTFNNVSRRVREDSGGEDKVFYLQKSLPGGIILFEVGLNEPFFYAKIHTLEATRIQSRRSRKALAYQVWISCFIDVT